MRSFVRYTLARMLLFVVSFGLVWLVGFGWLTWDLLTVLWTAMVALAVSGIASWWLLGRLRDDLATDVEARARRMTERLDRSRRAEDD